MRLSTLPLLAAAVAFALGLVDTASAQVGVKGHIAERWAAGNAMFVLQHEVAHLLIHQLGLPVLGREEDAADNIATHALLNRPGKAADQALIDSARGWLLSDTLRDELDKSYFYDVHSLDVQRSYAIVCLMVGFDPATFGDIADAYEIDEGRQESCSDDYRLVSRSLASLFSRFGDKTARATEVSLRYDDVGGELATAAEALRRSAVLEQIADQIRSQRGIQQPVQLSAQVCDEPNAFYDEHTVEIIFCYELMADFLSMAEADMAHIEVDAPEALRIKDKRAEKRRRAQEGR